MNDLTTYEMFLSMWSDNQLLKRARTCSIARGMYYDRYIDKIYNFVFHRVGYNQQLAEDITSKTFGKWRDKLLDGSLRIENVSGWLYTVAYNNIREHYRKKPEYSLDDFIGLSTPSYVENAVTNVQVRESLRIALGKLSRSDREILTLRFLEGLSRQEVAAVLRIKPERVSERVTRAKKKAREHMEQQGVRADDVRFALKHRPWSSLWDDGLVGGLGGLIPPMVALLVIFIALAGVL